MTRLRNLQAVLLATSAGVFLACSANPSSDPDDQPITTMATVQAADQSATLSMHPQLAQPGSAVADANAAKSSMTARFTPIREGRKVVLQRKTGSGWVGVSSARENGKGRAEFNAPYKVKGAVQTYRVSAVAADGYAKVTSSGVRADVWGDAEFTDQFAGTALGGAWSHRMQEYSPESKRACSKGDPRAVKVANGAVRLSALRDPDRDGPLQARCRYDGKKYYYRLNGHIGTEGTQSFRYGYAAARVKFQPRAGQHASFWLQPQTTEAVSGSAALTGAEIDVIEWFGNRSNDDLEMTSFIYHYPHGEPVKVGGFIKDHDRFGRDWATTYHVFSVEWTPQKYVFRIDGKTTSTITKGVSGQPQYPILSLLSSDYELPLLGGEDKLPQHMYVDWVRFWER